MYQDLTLGLQTARSRPCFRLGPTAVIIYIISAIGFVSDEATYRLKRSLIPNVEIEKPCYIRHIWALGTVGGCFASHLLRWCSPADSCWALFTTACRPRNTSASASRSPILEGACSSMLVGTCRVPAWIRTRICICTHFLCI